MIYSTDGNITVYDTATGRAQLWSSGGAAGQAQGGGSPRWSPDGKQIVLAGNRAELLVIRPDGPAARRLVGGNTYPAGWSSDGRWIAYQTSFGAGDGDLRIVREDGTHAHRISTATSMHPLADQHAGSDSDSVWSPDGSFVSFQRMDISGGFGVGLIVVDTRTGLRAVRRLGTTSCITHPGRVREEAACAASSVPAMGRSGRAITRLGSRSER